MTWLLILLLGLTVGSFLNVVIHRLPILLERTWQQEAHALLDREPPALVPPRYDLWVPRSACPQCARPLRVLENVPLLSFFWLRGRCAGCGQAISWRYPFIEALTAIAFATVFWRFGATVAGGAALLLTSFLIAAAAIDARTTWLPDSLTLPLLWLGLAVNSLGLLTDLHSSVLGAMAGYLSLWLVYQGFFWVTGREGMGYGDFKLFAALGAWLGWQFLPMILLLAALTGTVIGVLGWLRARVDRETHLPFGPYLAGAGWLLLLGGEWLQNAYGY
jgi:leader peptidase (prepilin peptidase)/N-methyltransferase